MRVEAELREAQEELHRVQAELQATDARLSVANEQGLQLHVETASTEEALQRLSGDHARLAELGQRGADGVRAHYSTGEMTTRALDVYERLTR